MAHSFFAETGGFAYRDKEGNSRSIRSEEFLRLCQANEIANPVITVKEIKALSKSDTLGKAFLALQLYWFTLQVIVRGSHGLAVTLVELDTVSMAALMCLVLCFWWEKPLRPGCPHISTTRLRGAYTHAWTRTNCKSFLSNMQWPILVLTRAHNMQEECMEARAQLPAQVNSLLHPHVVNHWR